MLLEGDLFPNFDLPDQDEKRLTPDSLKGKRTLVCFYPKDDTTGCTAEACGIRGAFPRFSGVTVFGVSPDSPASHRRFIAKYNLPFMLIADEEHFLAEACGVWIEKSMYGKKYMGIERTSFLLDENGKITKVWRKVKPVGHADEVLQALG
ncbi:MAG: thioredoxin-dependent thiol peroxidase [Armatimonadetes bacterium]|nr:thioredoxin-dependent thiol peroxidase [Armatimonadota bacterium]